MKIKLINIQGLTNAKFTELEEDTDLNTIYCLTETQKKVDSSKVTKKLQMITSMRDFNDRKVGGLIKTNNPDIKSSQD